MTETMELTPDDGQIVIVAGGIAQYRDGVFYTGMEEPMYQRPIEWSVTWWEPLRYQTSAPADVVEAQKIFDRFCRFIDGLYLNATFVENDFMTKHEQKIVRDALASLQPTNQPRKGRS